MNSIQPEIITPLYVVCKDRYRLKIRGLILPIEIKERDPLHFFKRIPFRKFLFLLCLFAAAAAAARSLQSCLTLCDP